MQRRDEQAHIIASTLDGAELRRQKVAHARHVVSRGGDDGALLSDVLENGAKPRLFFGLGDAWARIFGGGR